MVPQNVSLTVLSNVNVILIFEKVTNRKRLGKSCCLRGQVFQRIKDEAVMDSLANIVVRNGKIVGRVV